MGDVASLCPWSAPAGSIRTVIGEYDKETVMPSFVSYEFDMGSVFWPVTFDSSQYYF